MNFIYNMKIRDKLILMMISPLVFLLYLTVNGVVEKHKESAEMRSLHELSEIAVHISALVHELQKERGMTSAFIGSNGTEFVAELPAQRKLTGEKIGNLKNALRAFDRSGYRGEFKTLLDNGFGELKRIDSIRVAVDSLNFKMEAALDYYTDMNAVFLKAIGCMPNLSSNVKVSALISAYTNFLQAKEMAGLERAIISNTFARDNFAPGMYKKFIFLVAAQDAYIDIFLSFADNESLTKYKSTIKGDAVDAVEEMRKVAVDKATEGGFGIDAIYWFNMSTKKIDLLQEVEDSLSIGFHESYDVLMSRADSAKRLYVLMMALVLFISFVLSWILSKAITRPLGNIASLADDMANGSIDKVVEWPSLKGEIGQLVRSFKSMAQKVADRTMELHLQKEVLEEAQRVAQLGHWDWDMVNQRLSISDEFYRIFDLTPEERDDLSEVLLERILPEYRDIVMSAISTALIENKAYKIDYKVKLSDGRERFLHEESVIRLDEKGEPSRMVRTVQDVTDFKRVEEEAYKLSLAVEQSPVTVVMTDTDGNIEYVNSRFSELTGYSLEEVVGKTPRVLKTDYTTTEEYGQLWETISAGGVWQGEFLNKKKNGDTYWESAAISPIKNREGKITHYLGIKEDITDRKKDELEIRKLSAAIEQSINMIAITDLKGRIEYINKTFKSVTGYQEKDVLGKNFIGLTAVDMPREGYRELRETLLSGKNWRNTYISRKKNGDEYWVSTLTSPVRDEEGEITHFVSIQEDVTEKRDAQAKLEYLASYDALTGLINRNKFIEILSKWILVADKNDDKGALLLVNIDHFKMFNETYGHNMGDECLKSIAGLIKECFQGVEIASAAKNGAIIGRMGSDEFAIFLPSLGAEEGLRIAENLRLLIEGFHIEGVVFNVTARVGIVLYPEHGTTRKDLFTKSDAALYRAKELGQNTCHLYLPHERYMEEMHTKYEWKGRIQEALRDSRFEIWAQPILDLKNNEIYHYEILVRMLDKDGSIVSPNLFIPIAELFGLVGGIDRMVARKAMTLLAEKRKEGKAISFSINLSGKDLEDDEILAFMQATISETGVDASSIHFEITETAAIGDLARAIKMINSLKDMGCKISLDDFGVGFTSFVYLREMPIDYIKIDGSFIKNLHKNKNDQLFVKAITDVARGMGIKTIAEFVEEEETLGFLKEYGVDYGQGYHIAKPAPALGVC